MKGTFQKNIRFPKWLLDDYEEVKKKYPSLNFSKFVILAVAKDLNRYK